MASLIRARVTSVRPRGDGSFAVLLALGDRKYGWMLADGALRLGALLELEREQLEVRRVAPSLHVYLVNGGSTKVVIEPWSRRYVPQPWMEAAGRAVRVPLFPHQYEGAGWLAQRLSAGKGAILADDQGLGKTLQTASALLVARALPAIIVCPSSLKLGWERELRQLAVRLHVTVVDGFEGPIEPAHVIVTNYDLLRTREKQLGELGAKAIVFDEGQQLKEPSPTPAHRAAVATRLAERIGCGVVLSGTPLPNKLHELWRLLHIADPKEWPDFDTFRERYCNEPDGSDVLPGRHLVTEYGRVNHLDELQARMAPCMLRRLKRHVLPDLPPKHRRTVTVELDAEERELYDTISRDVVAWLRSVGYARRADTAARGQAFVKLTYLRKLAALAKLRRAVPTYLDKWFARHGRGLVIWCYHKPVHAGVRTICERLGLAVAEIRSQDDDSRRQANVDAFNAHKADVFIAPTRAAGVGLNLQHGGSDVLFLERLWTPSAINQAEDRVHRLGQREPVEVTFLDARNTVDEHIAGVLAAKQLLIDAVVDDGERPSDGEMERQTFDEVLAALADDGDGAELAAPVEDGGGTDRHPPPP